MKLPPLTAFILSFFVCNSQAVITLNTGFGPLVDEGGAAVAVDSSAFLVASTSDSSFADVEPTDTLSPGNFLGGGGGDDLILGKVTLIDGGGMIFGNGPVGVTLVGDLTVGDPVMFLFFSSDHDGTNPAAGVRYGTITSGDATSDAFVIPGDGFTGSLTNSDFTGGTYPTNLAVVPEPSSTLLILLGALSLFVRRRR
jgi:hypothetical protein